jgi:predicted phosphoribosyltransferase
VRVTSWDDARTIVNDARARADADEDLAEVERLKAQALAAIDEPALMTTMTTIVDGGLEIFFDRAGAAARAARITDPAVIRVAAGAASDAVYRAALAAAVGQPDAHRFIQRYELFTNGRWPLARIDNGVYLF